MLCDNCFYSYSHTVARPRAGAPVMWDMIWEQGMEQGRHCHWSSWERALERVAAIAAAHAADGNAGNRGGHLHVIFWNLVYPGMMADLVYDGLIGAVVHWGAVTGPPAMTSPKNRQCAAGRSAKNRVSLGRPK